MRPMLVDFRGLLFQSNWMQGVLAVVRCASRSAFALQALSVWCPEDSTLLETDVAVRIEVEVAFM